MKNDKSPGKWDYFKLGIKIHPGNIFYVVMLFALPIAAFQNDNNVASFSITGFFVIGLLILWFSTSVGVGKVNWKYKEEIENEF